MANPYAFPGGRFLRVANPKRSPPSDKTIAGKAVSIMNAKVYPPRTVTTRKTSAKNKDATAAKRETKGGTRKVYGGDVTGEEGG